MKEFIKKMALMTFSMFGIFSALPVAFCSPDGTESLKAQNKSTQSIDFGKIDSFHMMIVGKYFKNPSDFTNLATVNKKYRCFSDRYKHNPVEYDPEIFPNAETCYVFPESREFISEFPSEKVKLMIYLPGSFSSMQFYQVLVANGVNNNWSREVKLNDKSNPVYGCTASFVSKTGKEIRFEFFPMPSDSLGETIRIYNKLLDDCEIAENFMIDRENYSELKNIFIPGNLKSIGDSAFYDCGSLESVVVPCSVENIGIGAFYKCGSLKNINIPDSVTSIKVGAFQKCNSLSKITIPDSVTEIGVGAFCDCESLSEVTISNSITSIEKSVFSWCKSLKNVNIPHSVKSIKNNAFSNCSSLRSIYIPGSVESIESDAFRGCGSLESVNIGAGAQTIGPRVFHFCKNLKDVKIPDSVKSIGEMAFAGCEFLENIDIPNSIKTIDSFTFQNCVRLNNVVIPDSVSAIRSCAFKGCKGLKEITIPTSVINIGKEVFSGCNNLKCINFNGKTYSSVNDFILAFRNYRVRQFNMRRHNI